MAIESEDGEHPEDAEFTVELPPPSPWRIAEAPIGVRSMPIGSFMPEGTFRPIPITWLVAAWVVHNLAMVLLVSVLVGRPLVWTLCTTTLASLWIGHKAFAAGMAQASTGWKLALVLALLVNWALAVTAAAAMAGY
jgi:hypothetical protein